MKPLFHPQLVNDPFGDPALYVDLAFERRALLFDLGEVATLAPRKVLRLSHVFVSHCHMDHFAGFDRVLRICLGRDTALHLFGPPGFIAHLAHKLGAYDWNLVENYATNFTLIASEYHPDASLHSARFRCRSAFAREPLGTSEVRDGVLLDEQGFCVRAVHLDHKIPCLGFALEERHHINVWKNRLDALGLPTGPWLRELKRAVLRGDAPETPIRARWRDHAGEHEQTFALGQLRDQVLRIVPGQKLAYVTDVAYQPRNAERIVALAQGADQLFIEAVFLDSEAERAAATHHLTARQAGELGRRAGAQRLTPFHFSARYSGADAALRDELERAFRGR